ncbi:Transposase for insertion sequence element IS1086 [Dietzia timorensis]|uniref:Transposase for insertion sequence element IS1086 n=1 Tax=Dietzia timorensis TaxID=499555 RepID=A0A173LH84_9ACTN|nr:Transposase for insertion sequence element IS1086 [Dietzia timorensis]
MAERKCTPQQRERFFVLIDQGQSVRAASKSVGASPDAGYRWVKQAGLNVRRATPRKFTRAEEDEFFRRLQATPNVSAVARSMGINRVTCYKWTHLAGIFTGSSINSKREEYLRLRAAGWTRERARAFVGLDKRSAADADKGIQSFYGGRVLADGTVNRYTNQQIIERVKNSRTRYVQGERINLDTVDKVIHSRCLSIIEREALFDYLREGLTIRQIAARMERSPSTISRELRRNSSGSHGYRPHAAHRKAAARRACPRPVKLLTISALLGYVQYGLEQQWSPEQISRRLRQDSPSDPTMRLFPETIYQALYLNARPYLRRELCPHLRRGRRRRKPHRAPDQRRPRFTTPMTPLSQRPVVVNDRRQTGHWEGDLIVGHRGVPRSRRSSNAPHGSPSSLTWATSGSRTCSAPASSTS